MGLIKLSRLYKVSEGARCSSVVRASAHGVVDPLSYFLFQPVQHSWCNKGCGMYYPDHGAMDHRIDTPWLTH